MINSELIKIHRNNRSWSQDHLASVSGLSLRTIQRIENDGKCSLDSKKALASVFEINVNDLNFKENSLQQETIHKSRFYGMMGACFGMFCSYAAITYSLVDGSTGLGEAGIYYGIVGTITGIVCGLIGYYSNKKMMS